MQFVMTAGKRIELFIETMDSILVNVENFDKLNGYFLTIDSDEFEYERDLIKERYQFFNDIINVHGLMHNETLNKLWFEAATDDYIYHNEDDRIIILKYDFLKKSEDVLKTNNYQQVVIGNEPQLRGLNINFLNENYIEWIFDKEQTDKMFKYKNWTKMGPLEHNQAKILLPDFTLAPSILNRKWLVDHDITFTEKYNFERTFGYRACDKGFKRLTFNKVCHSHSKGIKNSLYDIFGRQR